MCLVEIIYSFTIPSVPHALFNFRAFIAISISRSLIGLFNDDCEILNASSFSKSAIFKKISGVAASAVAYS